MILIFGRVRIGKWPGVDVYSVGGRGDIKTLTVPDLERLAKKADEQEWSAVGRPLWLREQRDRVRTLLLVVFGTEGNKVYRCVVTAILNDGSGSSFTLDVSQKDFNRLRDISLKDLTKFAHLYLASQPMLDLDPDQQESWRRLKPPKQE